ncbi:MAG: phosphodiester glycosidase family protein, partial [Bacteroidales bacterium]
VVFHPVLTSEVILPDGSKVKIDNYNWWAKSHYGDCVLFNRFNSLKLADEGTYVRFKANGPWVVNGAPISCTVLDVGEEPQQTSDKEYVLFVRNAKRSLFDGLMKGDEIKISQNFEQGKFGKAPQDIVTAFHGYPSIAFEGKLHEGEYNDFENGREYELSSRLMGGVSKDGKTLYLAATELSSKSAGVNCIELANFMLAKGAWNVVNFDSGGSVAVVMDHTMQNEPGRGSIRPVEDGILFVSQAPESEVITKYQFTRKNLCIPSASLIDLHLIGYNKYMDIIERECTSFRFRCEPESLGWVDDNNFFHAIARKMSGKIIAEKDGISTELSVSLQEVEDVHLVTDKILLDDTHPYQIKIKATSMGNRFDLDPTAFI